MENPEKSVIYGVQLMEASGPQHIPYINGHPFNLRVYPFEVIYTSLRCFEMYNYDISWKLLLQWCSDFFNSA